MSDQDKGNALLYTRVQVCLILHVAGAMWEISDLPKRMVVLFQGNLPIPSINTGVPGPLVGNPQRGFTGMGWQIPIEIYYHSFALKGFFNSTFGIKL